MSKNYNVDIITPRRFPFKRFPDFKQQSKNKYTARNLTKDEARKYKHKARLRGFKVYVYDKKWDRNKYRKEFLKKYPEIIQCVYCGRKFPKHSITVDHIIPVAQAKKSRIARYLVSRLGYESINDHRNLTVACFKCNDRKKTSINPIWTIKAFLGKYPSYWIFYRLIQILLILAFIWIVLSF